MSVERFVASSRTALSSLLSAGGVAAGRDTIATWRGLAAQAKGLGLVELGALDDSLAKLLESRGSFAHAVSQPLSDTALSVFDRIEALASALAQWSVERAFEHPTGRES